jgi:hypothetical protein
LELASVFLLARFGRKTDGHIVFGHMFFTFLKYFLAYGQGLSLMARLMRFF